MLLIINLIILISQITSSPLTVTSEEPPEYRLPAGAVESVHYKIDLNLKDDFLETNTFEGYVEVDFKNLRSTNEIKIHANKLKIDEVHLESEGNEVDLTTTFYESDSVTDILTLITGTSLEETQYVLKFNYTGELRTDEMYGFYKSSYTTSSGAEHYLGTTQMEPTHARKVLPCFDEPMYKAKFDISITHPSRYNVYGNTLGTSTPSGDAVTTVFNTTPKMSTYLIAFVVSDFTCSDGEPIHENIPYRVCSRSETASTRELAVEVGPKLTRVIEDYTGVNESVSEIGKIDQVAIPDFSAGAMENWGLITYRETALLWDSEESSNRYKQRVETVVAHELSHFWFGNLVTCRWWSDIFLNEGFATYFEYFATGEIEPSWEIEKQFIIEVLQPSLVADASPSSSALSSDVSSPSEISQRFDTISYNKGGSIFRMVRSFMGLDRFKEGLRQYLETNQFKAVEPADLWSAFENHKPEGLPDSISNIMQNWIEKPGFPVIKVAVEGKSVKLSQKRYLSSSGVTDDTTWWVPITYTTESDTHKFENTLPNLWLDPTNAETPLQNILQNQSDWIILNNQQVGYYRVDYSSDLWNRIENALNQPGFDGIGAINRAQLLDDLFNFARYGYHSFTRLLRFYEFLKRDTSYYSWYAAMTAINNIMIRIGDEKLRDAFTNYVLDLIEVPYNLLPFNVNKDNDQIYTHEKVLIVPWACKLGLKNCVDNALAAFARYKTEEIKPNKNMRSVVYCNGLRHSKDVESDWNFLWGEFLKAPLATEQITLISSLGCARNATILRNYLGKSIDSSSGIRQQDALSVFSAVYTGNPEGVDVALDFLTENFETISAYYGSMNSMRSLLNGLAARFTKQDQIDKFKAFINSTDLGDHSSAADAALKAALANLEWMEQFEQEMNLYFKPTTTEPSTSSSGSTETDSPDNDTADVVFSSFATVLISLTFPIYLSIYGLD